VGFPDPETFFPTFKLASDWLDSWVEEQDLAWDRVVLGGFSQGCVMSYALALGPGRPRPAGILGLSGFIPTVEGFDIELNDLSGYPVAIGHGSYDPVIEVAFGRSAKERLEAAGADVTYRESPLPHTIDPSYIPELTAWLERVLSLA
jgi:phospholipase/carboxylesterase